MAGCLMALSRESRHSIRTADQAVYEIPSTFAGMSEGFRRWSVVNGENGSVHQEFNLCELAPGGSIIHELGGAIMGSDAKQSVTNRFGQTWDVKNLFIADGAVFASNADKNPTLTIMALAWRAADHILERMSRKEL